MRTRREATGRERWRLRRSARHALPAGVPSIANWTVPLPGVGVDGRGERDRGAGRRGIHGSMSAQWSCRPAAAGRPAG